MLKLGGRHRSLLYYSLHFSVCLKCAYFLKQTKIKKNSLASNYKNICVTYIREMNVCIYNKSSIVDFSVTQVKHLHLSMLGHSSVMPMSTSIH